METFLWFAITLLLAILFGTSAMKLKIPAGSMLGAMIAVAVFNLLFDKAYIYKSVKVIVQILLGAMSGSRVGRAELKKIWKLIIPLVLMIFVCLSLNVVFGAVIVNITSLDIRTALLSITPGGATDMIFVANDIGADASMVGVIQSLRMIYCNGVLSIIYVALIKKYNEKHYKKTVDDQTASLPQKAVACDGLSPKSYYKRLTVMLAAAACGGLLFKVTGVPGGTLVGAMLFTVIYCCIFGKVTYPNVIKRYLQVITGAYIGAGITMSTVAMLPSMALAMALVIVDIMIYVFLMSFILRKTSRMDYGTCLLCSTPGGIAEVSILSEELGTDTSQVATLNTARMIVVVCTFPTILQIVSLMLS